MLEPKLHCRVCGRALLYNSKQHQQLYAVDMSPNFFYTWCANSKGEQQCKKVLVSGAEASSAADGVDTAVGEATEVARTGNSTKTQSKSQDPKVQVKAVVALAMHASIYVCKVYMLEFCSVGLCMT